jgi:PST family polysaccharide transporter
VLLAPKTLQAFSWSLLNEAIGRVLPLLTFVVLALLLVPEDFGVLAAAMVVISLCAVVAEAGLAKAIVQTEADPARAASTALTVAAALGMAVALLLWVTAPWLAGFFQDDRLIRVIRALAPLSLLAAFTNIPSALLQRQMRFRALTGARLAGAVTSASIAIPLAWTGAGFWALVVSTLLAQLVQMVVTWSVAGWRPGPGLLKEEARSLLVFGGWATASALLAWGFLWVDSLVVARFLGAHDMGLYRMGNSLVIAIFGLVFAPLLPVLYSVFSRHQGDLAATRADLESAVRVIAVIALPVAAVLMLTAPLLDFFLTPYGWSGMGAVLGMLGICHGLGWLVGANGEALRGVGRPQGETLAMAIATPLYLVIYLVAIKDGLDAFLWARVLCTVIGVILHMVIARVFLSMSMTRWLALLMGPILLAAAIGAVSAALTRVESQFLAALAIFSSAAAMWGAYLYFFERQRLGLLWTSLRHKKHAA